MLVRALRFSNAWRRSGRKVSSAAVIAELLGEIRPGACQLARYAHQRRVEAEPGLGADDHQVERVGQPHLHAFTRAFWSGS